MANDYLKISETGSSKPSKTLDLRVSSTVRGL